MISYFDPMASRPSIELFVDDTKGCLLLDHDLLAVALLSTRGRLPRVVFPVSCGLSNIMSGEKLLTHSLHAQGFASVQDSYRH